MYNSLRNYRLFGPVAKLDIENKVVKRIYKTGDNISFIINWPYLFPYSVEFVFGELLSSLGQKGAINIHYNVKDLHYIKVNRDQSIANIIYNDSSRMTMMDNGSAKMLKKRS